MPPHAITLADYVNGPLVSSLLASMYVLWGLAWLAVAHAYGRAAYASWIYEGGKWHHIPRDMWRSLSGGAKLVWISVCNVTGGCFGLKSRPLPAGADGKLAPQFTPGHQMRWAIFISSITPAIRGFYSSLTVTWSDWSWIDVVVNAGGTLISIVAARHFLFLAYRSKPVVWGIVLLLAVFWFLAGPVILWELGYGAQPRPPSLF